MGDIYFKFPEFFSMKQNCEQPTATYLNNIYNGAWQEPRLFSLKQLRDVFYAITFQSKLKMNMDE